MNKNQLRENLRKHIHDAAYLDMGVERIVDQVVNPKVYSIFMPQIEDVVYKFLGIERPKDIERNGTKNLKDLLPKDLDPVSPESDKNSLKDVSLESVDANITGNSNRSDNSPAKDTNTIETNIQSSENANEKEGNDNNSSNRQLDSSDNQLEYYSKNSSKNVSTTNLNVSGKSDEKVEEEEEDSPMFEPIDIMNFNESNDSHLSGISELTSHRSRSPDFSNDFSRDNLDFSNHDSQLSKVSSDSRLSIVTDFGLSNHASTPMPAEVSREESIKGKSVEPSESKCNKDNFKAIRDIEPDKVNAKEGKISIETIRSKDNAQEQRESKDSKVIKSTLDSTDGGMKDSKNDCKDSKEKHNKDNDTQKGKSNKEKSDIKDSKTHKEREKDHRKRQTSHSSSKHDKMDKNSKDKYKDKFEKSRDSSEKCKEYLEKSKDAEKPREDKKDFDKKDSAGKDLKDIYKEKIRELREKKELTEKEKLAKDPRESKSTKDSRDRKDSSRDRKDSKSSSRHDEKTNKNDEKSASKSDSKSTNSKSSGKGVESKDSKSESKDKGKREDKRQSKDGKESRSKSHGNQKNDAIERGEKSDAKKDVKNDSQIKESERSERLDTKRDNKTEFQKSETKKDLKTESQTKDYERNDKLDGKKDPKADSQNKDKKKKGDKKTKVKDDHSSLRKNQNDRRSTDRDGSNGSSSRSSQKSNSSSITNSSKTGSTSLTKESSGTSNSSSEASDNVDISPSDEVKLQNESMLKNTETTNRVKPLRIKITNENESEPDYYIESELTPQRVDLGQTEFSLPLKKRPLQGDPEAPNPNDFKVKKPKFAKNFQEAKRLMKIRKRLEKQRLKEYEAAKEKFQIANSQSQNSNPLPVTECEKNTAMLPDDERVQIIEVTDDDYEEPYPDLSMKEMNISLGRQSLKSLENPLMLNPQESVENILEKRTSLSAMEKSIRESLEEMISDRKLLETKTPVEDKDDSTASVRIAPYNTLATMVREIVDTPEDCKKCFRSESAINNLKNTNCLKTKVSSDNVVETTKVHEVSIEKSEVNKNSEKEESKETSKVGIADHLEDVDSRKGGVDTETSSIREEEKKDSNSISSVSDEPIISSSGIESTNKEASNESLSTLDDKRNCLYFEADDERAVKFSKFLQSFEVEVSKDKTSVQNPSESLEKILESLGGQIVSSLPKTMAPPMTKRKHSTSPLMDILLNNTNNNNNRHKIKESTPEEDSNTNKKRKLGRLKKPRAIANVCAIQNLPNGENFVMPLSPESDVSASSEKNSLHLMKEDKR